MEDVKKEPKGKFRTKLYINQNEKLSWWAQ